MKIGFIEFEDGDMVQGWNCYDMSHVVRKQIATQLIDVAVHMLHDEFLEGSGKNEMWVKRKPKVKRKNKK